MLESEITGALFIYHPYIYVNEVTWILCKRLQPQWYVSVCVCVWRMRVCVCEDDIAHS